MTISLTEEEMIRMRAFYEQEYVALSNKMSEVRAILSKLGVSTADIGNPVTPSIAIVSAPAKARVADKKTRKYKKKRGPKPRWTKFILQQLKEADRPMTYAELIRNAMVVMHKQDGERPKVKAAVLNAAFRLRNKEFKIDTIGQDGKKGVLIVSKSWVGEDGKLLSPYNHKYDEMINAGEI